jgi:hypothetical protein|tara:strand:+ start:41 stop:445 length:405 start_codon:yes stop_codon:yes gene_type:complete
VQEEASDELVGVEGKEFDLVVVGSVLVGEGDLAVVNRDDAMIGDSDPMGVASEIAEELLRTGERRLCIGDPVGGGEFVEQLREGFGISERGYGTGEDEGAAVVCISEELEVLSAEVFGKGAYFEEVGGASGFPG